MKRIICLIFCLIAAFSLVACNNDEEPKDTKPTTSSSQQANNEEDKKVIYKVSGKEYKVDMSTINVAWDEDNAPTQINKDNFISLMKNEFGSSKITFTSENSFTLTGTNNQNHDFEATDCERIDNELFKEIATKGNVDVLIYEDKVSFLCDFFVKGWGMYISIDYVSE
ncbi:MAG: hypothetical protein J6D23_04245 [Clostridia bacterium]|nr:hypothetical protein [Clostridia bacterium]